MNAPDGDDYTWEKRQQIGYVQAMGPEHVAGMEQVIRLWPYASVVALGVLLDVLGFVRHAANGHGEAKPAAVRPMGGGGDWDWRREFGPLEAEECYDCDQ